MHPIMIATILLLGGFPADNRQVVQPRLAAVAIAEAIEENYFDPGRAAAVATEIRENAREGSYDHLTDQELARTLTALLKAHDSHFEVEWTQAESDETTEDERDETRSAETPGDYGFVEIKRLPGNIGYLDLRYFARIDFSDPDDGALKTAGKALGEISDADAIIIDLRNNDGGAWTMSGYIISAFVEHDRPVYNQFHHAEGIQSEAPETPYPNPNISSPLYILTGPRTFSAAESVAYTLQAAGRATVVGAPTGGGANPGTFFDVDGGFRVFISLAKPINPVTATNWDKTGVQPDIAVAPEDALGVARKEWLERKKQATAVYKQTAKSSLVFQTRYQE
jgi:C-terminal processing protease CtpA/Prc